MFAFSAVPSSKSRVTRLIGYRAQEVIRVARNRPRAARGETRGWAAPQATRGLLYVNQNRETVPNSGQTDPAIG